ncbi:MAG TPA: CBS domain-containing protein [Nitrospinota bacterium]|nr:CBS domain-containing protein [Nitrospinota bacterium]
MADVQSLLTVKDLIKDEPVFVESESSVLSAAKKIKEQKVDSVLIKDASGSIEGIVTESDIICKVVAENESPSETKVEKIMTKKILTIDGNESMFKAREIMLDNKVRYLIVTENEKQIGVVTSKEILGK